MTDIFDQLVIPEEGERLKVYDDATGDAIVPGYNVIGHPTIGIGRALDTQGLSEEEKTLLYQNDKQDFIQAVLRALPWAAHLAPLRLGVLCAMAFQMGITGMLNFTQTLAALQDGNWQAAHDAMLDSKWAKQTPARAQKMAQIILTNDFNQPST